MDLLDKLSKLFKVDLSKLKKFHIHILSDNQHKNLTVDNRKINNVTIGNLTINIAKLEPQKIPQLQAIVKDLVTKDDELLIEDNANKTIEDFKEVDSQTENKKLLEYFKGKISPRDIEILRASLYLKSVYERGENVSQLKQDIMNRYGDRGKNISNLCSADYFTSQIKPLYEEMYSQLNFSAQDFLKVYEIIITESPYAVFINTRMSEEDVKNEVLNKMEIDKKYGIKYLNIHGIGKDNVDKIANLLKELTPKLAQTPEITKGERFIVVKIWF